MCAPAFWGESSRFLADRSRKVAFVPANPYLRLDGTTGTLKLRKFPFLEVTPHGQRRRTGGRGGWWIASQSPFCGIMPSFPRTCASKACL